MSEATNTTSAEFKRITSQLTKLRKLLEEQLKVSKSAQQAVNATQHKIKQVEKELERLPKEEGVVVSEHAILRYLERVKGLDISAIVEELSGQKVKQSVAFAPTCKIKRADHTLVVENRVIVTVLPND
jgi:alanyl-tRNA synthetase